MLQYIPDSNGDKCPIFGAFPLPYVATHIVAREEREKEDSAALRCAFPSFLFFSLRCAALLSCALLDWAGAVAQSVAS